MLALPPSQQPSGKSWRGQRETFVKSCPGLRKPLGSSSPLLRNFCLKITGGDPTSPKDAPSLVIAEDSQKEMVGAITRRKKKQ